jgi:uncharacterized iron-regulated membrane protein
MGADEHAGHGAANARTSAGVASYRALNRFAPIAQAAHLAPPVLIAPPSGASTQWTARSDTQNRPQRVTLQWDENTATILSRQRFSDRPLMDRIVGVGVAAHEGQLFAPLNQVLGLVTTAGLITLSVSAIVLWWRRRPAGVLGAPPAVYRPKLAWTLFAIVAVLGVLLPLLGATLIGVLCIEQLVLRRLPAAREFLGLDPRAA